ncbi:MAG: LCP family protein [Christensenellales bacterium]|jgi:LCP family protein required for cell wall assembly
MSKHGNNGFIDFIRRRWILLTSLALAGALIAAGAAVALQIIIPRRAFDRSLFERNRPGETPAPDFPEWKALALRDLVEGGTAPPTDRPVEPPVDYDFSKNRINILVLGLDSSDERVAAGMSFRSDTIILVSVNFTDNTVDMLSIPRDTYTAIYNKDTRNKINSAFSFGGGAAKDGFKYSVNTVSAFLDGIPIDYYVGFDMNVVKQVINIMGGVWYDVDISFTMAGRPMKTGYQLLNGQQVLDYCRWRYSAGGDIGRIDRQQRMLTAIFQQLKSTRQIKNIPDIYAAITEGLYTNLETVQIAALANFMLTLGVENIDRHTVQGESLMMDDISYYVIDQQKKQQLIKKIFGVTITYDPEEDVNYIKQELERIRKELQAAIAESRALQEAVGAMLASQDAPYLTEAEITRLKSGIARCEDAVDMQTKELIENETAALKQEYNELKAQIANRKSLRTNAQKTLNSAQANVTRYAECLRSEDRARIDQSTAALSAALAHNDYAAMETHAAWLSANTPAIFEECGRLEAARSKLLTTADIARDMVDRHEGLYIEDRAALHGKETEGRSLLSGYDTAAIEAKEQELHALARESLDDFYAALNDEIARWTQEERGQCADLVAAISEASEDDEKLGDYAESVEALYQEMKTLRPEWTMELHKPVPTPKPQEAGESEYLSADW